jgi:hypothetical protein
MNIAMGPTRIAGICERDIDLLLLEEMMASASFRTWFVAHSAIDEPNLVRLLGAERSVTHTTGESDLEIRFEDADGSTVVMLIENKIGAALQPLQAERYRERGGDYVAKGHCARYRTIIVAPAAYFGRADEDKGFGHRMSYEALAEWFEAAVDLGERRHYKALMLRSAIEKAIYGYRADADHAVTDFFQEYWRIATQFHPELGMLKPSGRPSGSGRVYFKRPETGSIRADVAHKTGKGFVDLHLRGRGSRLSQVTAALSPLLEKGMSIEPAQKSAAVRLHVPKLDRQLPAAQQADDIRLGLVAAEVLTAWAIRHTRVLAAV